MSPWVRTLFINVMPKLLFMQRPNYAPRYTSNLNQEDIHSVRNENAFTLSGMRLDSRFRGLVKLKGCSSGELYIKGFKQF